MRAVRPIALLIAALTLLGACTSSGGTGPTPTPSVRTQTVIGTTTPAPSPTAPVSTGPTTAAAANDCPYLSRSAAHFTSGLRLDRITVLRSGGKVVGCRYYGLQHPTSECSQVCLSGEHLPPANQPAVELKIVRYPSAVAAHNALATRFTGEANVQQDEIGATTGLCFQTGFYAKDNGTDWACAFTRDSRLVVVSTVVTSPSSTVAALARAFAKKL